MQGLGYEAEKIIVLLDGTTKESKGTAFVKFALRDDAKECLQVTQVLICLNKIETQGRSP